MSAGALGEEGRTVTKASNSEVAHDLSEALRYMKTLDFVHADFCHVQHLQFKEMDRRKKARAVLEAGHREDER